MDQEEDTVPLLDENGHQTAAEVSQGKIKHENGIGSDILRRPGQDQIKEDSIPHETDTVRSGVEEDRPRFSRRDGHRSADVVRPPGEEKHAEDVGRGGKGWR